MSIELKLESIENGYTMWYRSVDSEGNRVNLDTTYFKTKEECVEKVIYALEKYEGSVSSLTKEELLKIKVKYLSRVKDVLQELKDELDVKFDVIKKDLESEMSK